MEKSKAMFSATFLSVLTAILSFILTYNVYFITLKRLGVYIPPLTDMSVIFYRDVTTSLIIMFLTTAAVISLFSAIIISLKYFIKEKHLTSKFDKIDGIVILLVFIWLLFPPFIAFTAYNMFLNSVASLVFVLWFVYPSSVAVVIFTLIFLLKKTEPRVRKQQKASKLLSKTSGIQKQTSK